jgi:hypothetical protein
MSGSRQGDFSRFTFQSRKHWSGVFLQQGRALLDADWNAQADLVAHRIRTGTADLVGPSGGPAADPGFEILPSYALEFDGKGAVVRIGGSEGRGLTVPAEWTIEAWIAPVKPGGTVLSMASRVAGQTGFTEDSVLTVETDGRVRLHRETASAPDPVSDKTLPFGTPSHVAVVRAAREVRIHVNGVLSARAAEDAAGWESEVALLLGAGQDAAHPSPPYAGIVYELRVWGRARTPEEIGQAARPDSLSGREEGLLGNWRFDRGFGVTVDDRHPHGLRAHLGDGRERRPRWVLRGARVGAGRYYVDGLLCANEERVVFTRQPDLPGAELPAAGPHVFYLDVWERSVTAIEDPALLEVALGGADTTTRARTIAQVKTLPVGGDLPEEALRGRVEGLPEWKALLGREGGRGALQARRQPEAASTLGNLLYRVEIHGGGGVFGASGSREGAGAGVRVQEIEVSEKKSQVTLEDPLDCAPGGWVELYSAGDGAAAGEGILARVQGAAPRGRNVELDQDVSKLAARKDLHLRPIASFKWSRGNGAAAWPVAALEAGSQLVRLKDLGRDDLDLRAGEWVEIVDDAAVLRGRSGPLLQVQTVDPAARQVTLAQRVPPGPGQDPALHPLLRRWDGGQGAVPIQDGWVSLEAEIEVSFAKDGLYRAGDHWWIPVRTVTGEVEWPADSRGEPESRPPAGTDHRYTPLALLVTGEEGLRLIDCRRIFHPLTGGAVSKEGDTVEGSLAVRGDLAVEGEVTASVLRGTLVTPGAVTAEALADGVVTPEKLAPGVVSLPAGASILTESSSAPPGFEATGFALTLWNTAPSWSARREIPRVPDGPLACAVARGRVWTVLESGELWEYDPASNGWHVRRAMAEPRQGFALASLGDRLYVIGGLDPQGRGAGAVQEYDPATDRWTARSPIPTPRYGLAAAAFGDRGGRIFALGGLRGPGKVTAANEAYDPDADAWTAARPCPEPRHGFGAAALGDRIHAVGGEGRAALGLGRTRAVDHHVYHPGTDRWENGRAPLPAPPSGHAVAGAGGRLWVVGGQALFGETGAVESYDPAANLWSSGPTLPRPIAQPGAAAVDGTLYALGGKTSPDARSVLVESCPVVAAFHLHRRR